ncbi:hypothetical protein BH09MYX1_BH09MYX1_45180 [soil metagenome]
MAVRTLVLFAVLFAGCDGCRSSDDAPAAARPAACAGADLDLDALDLTTVCVVAPASAPEKLPSGLAFHGDGKPITVAYGRTTDVPLALENQTDQPISVNVDARCGMARAFAATASRGGTRFDLPATKDCIEEARACPDHTLRITIFAHGRARLSAPAVGATRAFAAGCTAQPSATLARGTYDLVIASPWLDDPAGSTAFTIPLEVK